MKKQLYLLAGVAAALASCSKTETVEQPSEAIGFSGAYIGNTVESKVDENTTAKLTTFQVFGQYDNNGTPVKIFEDVPVTTTDGGTSWTYTGGIRTWVPDKDYVFAAYAPKEALTNPTVNPTGYLNIGSYTSDANHQHDLIYATQKHRGQASANPTVSFTFKHLLSWVRLSLKSTFSDEYEVTVSDVTVTGILPTNTFTPADEVTSSSANGGSWGIAGGASTPFTFNTGTIPHNSEYTANMVVVPQSIGTVTVSFNVTVKDITSKTTLVNEEPVTATLPKASTPAWEMGNRYTYVATIQPSNIGLEEIKFTVDDVTGWTNQDIITLPITE